MTVEVKSLKSHVENILTKASKIDKSDDALRFSQAALNAANAIRQLNDTFNK